VIPVFQTYVAEREAQTVLVSRRCFSLKGMALFRHSRLADGTNRSA